MLKHYSKQVHRSVVQDHMYKLVHHVSQRKW